MLSDATVFPNPTIYLMFKLPLEVWLIKPNEVSREVRRYVANTDGFYNIPICTCSNILKDQPPQKVTCSLVEWL